MNKHAIIVIKRNSYRALFVVNTFVKFRRRYITLEKRDRTMEGGEIYSTHYN